MSITTLLVNNLLQIIEQIENEHNNLEKKLKATVMAQDDMLHEIELSTFNACEGYKLSRKLQEIRKERRIYKDELEKMTPLIAYVKKYKQNMKADLGNVLKHVTNLESRERKYAPRIIADLKITPQTKEGLSRVNKANIKFHEEQDRIEEILKQIK